MPLSKTGNKLLTRFVQEYGSKRGKSVFYAKTNASKKFAKLVGEKK